MNEKTPQLSKASKASDLAGVNSKKRKRVQPEGVSNQGGQPRQQSRSQHSNGHGVNKVPRLGPRGRAHAAMETNPKAMLRKSAESLWTERIQLPVWKRKNQISQALTENDVLLLTGETGSGKSTQVPQILRTETWFPSRSVEISDDQGRRDVKVGGCIAVTEPRRVAAISLARRVAAEMGTPFRAINPPSAVGYSVRFDNATTSNTKIKYLTEGMLLQEMLRDPWLRAYSAVVVDEVHERSVNVDLILGFLRQMLAGENEGRGGIPLKVVVMSATAEMMKLQTFFEKGCTPSWEASCGLQSSQDAPAPPLAKDTATLTNGANETHSRKGKPITVAKCYLEGRQYHVEIQYTKEPVVDIVDASLHTIFQIHNNEPDGDILVFLTGQEAVESLERLVVEYAKGLKPDVPRMLVRTLFAALPQSDQQRVFERTPPRTRKVIIATNIAETSVTVPGVHYVIDCGKAKVTEFRTNIGLDSLLVKPISRSAAIQRKGRAGREAAGQCYRLYPESEYLRMQESATPEIRRCDLRSAILTMKARGVDDPINFPLLDRPRGNDWFPALSSSIELGALDEEGAITEIGRQMATLPLPVTLGRVLVEAATSIQDYLPEVIDIISCLSVENVFLKLNSDEKKEKADEARKSLYHREGDHLTLLSTLRGYAAEMTNRRAWSERHYVSHRAMQSVMQTRKQLCDRYNVSPKAPTTTAPATPEAAEAILRCFLKGFAANVAGLCKDGSYKTIQGNQTVAIHPSSVLHGKKVEAIMYNEFIYTRKAYARGVSAVQANWVEEAIPA